MLSLRSTKYGLPLNDADETIVLGACQSALDNSQLKELLLHQLHKDEFPSRSSVHGYELIGSELTAKLKSQIPDCRIAAIRIHSDFPFDRAVSILARLSLVDDISDSIQLCDPDAVDLQRSPSLSQFFPEGANRLHFDD